MFSFTDCNTAIDPTFVLSLVRGFKLFDVMGKPLSAIRNDEGSISVISISGALLVELDTFTPGEFLDVIAGASLQGDKLTINW